MILDSAVWKMTLISRKGAAKSKGLLRQKNPKLEIRNLKQIQMIKTHEILNKLVSDFDFLISGFGLFRISSFGISDFISVASWHE